MVLLLPVVVALQPSCGRNDDDPEVRQAFESLLAALDGRNVPELWQFANDPTREAFDSLAAEILSTIDQVDRLYPEKDRAAARKAIGADLVFTGARGKDLFAALLDGNKLAGPSNPKSRIAERIVVGGNKAIVVTAAGETLEMVRDESERWRVGLFLEAFNALPATSTLRDNLATAKQNCTIIAASLNGTPQAGAPAGAGR
jgi:hypothetical protein